MSEAKAKAVNYTVEMTTSLVEGYKAGTSVETLAATVGRSVRSVVAKLSREGVYKKKEYVTKTGESVVKKDAVADAIGAVLDMTEPEIESLTKANKTALSKIFKFLSENKATD